MSKKLDIMERDGAGRAGGRHKSDARSLQVQGLTDFNPGLDVNLNRPSRRESTKSKKCCK